MSMDITKLKEITDNIAKNIKELSEAKAQVDSNIANMKDVVDDIGDDANTFYEKDLDEGVKMAMVEAKGLEFSVYKAFTKALATAIYNYKKQTLSDYIESTAEADERFPAYFQDMCIALGMPLNPANVFPKKDILMGTVNISAQNPLTAVSDPIDLSKYGGALLKIKVTTKVENNDSNPLTVTIKGVDANDSPWGGEVEIPHNSDINTEIDVTPTIVNTYCAKVTSVELGDNKSAGVFQILTREDRDL